MGQKTVDIGVGGMSCASCVARLESALSRISGTERVAVNLATERATITYDPAIANVSELTQAIEDLGYQVRTDTASLPIRGMTRAACVNSLERGRRQTPGGLSASVTLATSRGAGN